MYEVIELKALLFDIRMATRIFAEYSQRYAGSKLLSMIPPGYWSQIHCIHKRVSELLEKDFIEPKIVKGSIHFKVEK